MVEESQQQRACQVTSLFGGSIGRTRYELIIPFDVCEKEEVWRDFWVMCWFYVFLGHAEVMIDCKNRWFGGSFSCRSVFSTVFFVCAPSGKLPATFIPEDFCGLTDRPRTCPPKFAGNRVFRQQPWVPRPRSRGPARPFGSPFFYSARNDAGVANKHGEWRITMYEFRSAKNIANEDGSRVLFAASSCEPRHII